jgi:hypothetical protein
MVSYVDLFEVVCEAIADVWVGKCKRDDGNSKSGYRNISVNARRRCRKSVGTYSSRGYDATNSEWHAGRRGVSTKGHGELCSEFDGARE